MRLAPSTKEKIDFFLRHPLTLSLTGMLLGLARALTGTNDLGHARAVDEPIADWLNANGAKAEFIYLGDLGITGNGHMLMLERNSDALAQLIIDWIES